MCIITRAFILSNSKLLNIFSDVGYLVYKSVALLSLHPIFLFIKFFGKIFKVHFLLSVLPFFDLTHFFFSIFCLCLYELLQTEGHKKTEKGTLKTERQTECILKYLPIVAIHLTVPAACTVAFLPIHKPVWELYCRFSLSVKS